MCHVHTILPAPPQPTHIWPVVLKTKQNFNHVIFLPKQWIPKIYTAESNLAWPQGLSASTNIPIIETNNSPLQTLNLINFDYYYPLNTGHLSYLFTHFFSLLGFFSPFSHHAKTLPASVSGKLVSWLKSKSLSMSWVQNFVSLLCNFRQLFKFSMPHSPEV